MILVCTEADRCGEGKSLCVNRCISYVSDCHDPTPEKGNLRKEGFALARGSRERSPSESGKVEQYELVSGVIVSRVQNQRAMNECWCLA